MTDREKVVERLGKVSYYFKSLLAVGWQDDADIYREHRESVNMAIALLKEQPKWIPVEDKLPEEHESIFYKLLGTPKWSNSMWKQESEKVLVYVSFPDGTGVVTTGCLHNSDWMTTVSRALPQTVTHWMPLPKPPEGE